MGELAPFGLEDRGARRLDMVEGKEEIGEGERDTAAM